MKKIDKDYATDEQNKIYILGGRGVGKTSFFRALFSEKFDEHISPSENGIKKLNLEKGKKIFTIKELTDDESFSFTNIFKNELEDVILVFVIFALNDKNSFEEAKTMIKFITNNLTNNDLNIFLLGNKYDVGETNKNEIKVTKKEVEQYFKGSENFFYREISCKTNYNIDTIKKVIEETEVDQGEAEDDGNLTEDERNKRLKESEGSCLII